MKMFKTELNENFDFMKTCRLCLNQTNELISIFDQSNFELEYSIIISQCTDVLIYENDELPKIICLECVDCLNKYYKFRKLVKNSEHLLTDFLNKFRNNLNTNVKIENTIYIKQENLDITDCSEKPTTCSNNKNEKDPLSLEENSQVESKLVTVKEELEVNEHEPTSITSNSEKTTCKTRGFDIIKLRDKETNKSKRVFSCNKCTKSYNRLDNLRKHERLHTGDKLHICKECNKPFTNESHLKEHERVHTGEKPFVCDQCGKSFSRAFFLKKHCRIHTGEKFYSCKQCEKSFNNPSNLKVHERIHTGEKPYSCDECEKSFTTSTDLKRHLRIHSGEKPYSCLQCGKLFALLSNLRKHEKVHIVT